MSRDDSFDERSDDSQEREAELDKKRLERDRELAKELDDDNDEADDDSGASASITSVSSTASRRGRGLRGQDKGRGRADRSAKDDRIDAITGNGGSSDSRKGYRFDLDGDSVINLRQVKGGRERRERIEAGDTWTFVNSELIHRELEDSGTEVSTYADPNNDGIFTRISEVFTPFSASSTPIA